MFCFVLQIPTYKVTISTRIITFVSKKSTTENMKQQIIAAYTATSSEMIKMYMFQKFDDCDTDNCDININKHYFKRFL